MEGRFDWEQGFDRFLLLKKIGDCRKIAPDGRVSFSDARDYHYWLPVLETAVRAADSVGHLKHSCIAQAIGDSSVTLKDDAAFLRRCDEAYDRLLSKPKSKFVAVMSITYSGPPLFARLNDGDVGIQWQPKPNARFMRAARKARDGLADIRRSHNIVEEPVEITNLLVHVQANDAFQAHTAATDSVDTLRGMLNLFVNSTRGINIFALAARPHAFNRFRPGPYRTIHKEDGSLATKTFWYEHRWLHETPSVKFNGGGTAKFNKNLRGWWSKLQRNPLRNHIRQGLLRYCRALDLHDVEPALLEMWGALESLTGTQRERYEVTVNRTVRLFTDRAEARQVARHIQLRRNSTIHAARNLDRQEADAIIIQAELLVSQILFFCLKNGHRFADPKELFSFLELSLDGATLKRNVALAKFFVEYQERRRLPNR